MKKVLTVLIIITLTVLAGVTIFLGCTVFKNKDEISSLKKQAEIHEQENKEYKNKIDSMETKISKLEQLIKENSKNNGKKESNYEILEKLPEEISFDKETKGEEIIEFENYYYVIIKLGQRSTDGYSVSVKDIEIDGKNVKIYVEEHSPAPMSTVGMILTYPYTAVKFDFKPNVKVIYDDEY